MARAIVKTITATRVSFKTVAVEDGIPCFVDQPDAVFSGQQDKDKVERLLKGRLGKDAMIVITNIDAGQHRYEMTLEEFVLNAHIVDDSADEADEADAADTDTEDADIPSQDSQENAQDAAAQEAPVSEPAVSEPLSASLNDTSAESADESPATANQDAAAAPDGDETGEDEEEKEEETLPF